MGFPGSGKTTFALLPVAHCLVAGLPVLMPGLKLHSGRLPASVLTSMLRDAQAQARHEPREVLYHVLSKDSLAWVVRPAQHVSATHIRYTGGHDPAIVLDLHSHQEMRAYFSHTDTADEQGCRLYAVIGHIFAPCPQIALRVGVYGDFMRVSVKFVFDGWEPFVEVDGNG